MTPDGARQPLATNAPAWTDPQRRSFQRCHEITRHHARNFYYGLRLTPEPKRSAMYAVYAFMRACDDLVDNADLPDKADTPEPNPNPNGRDRVERIAHDIEEFRHRVYRLYAEESDGVDANPAAIDPDPEDSAAPSIWPAFRYVVRHYDIDPHYLDAMLDGQRQDLTTHRYDRFDELYDYCYRVASVVGLVCLQVWDYDGGSATRKLAEYRGVALQLTNIIRDIAEDAQRGRIYLPHEDLDRFGVTEADLLAGRDTTAVDRLLTYQVERARGYYDLAAGLENHVASDCRPTCWVMMRIYRQLLEKIAADPRRALAQRVRLGRPAKLALGLRAITKRRFN